MTMVRWHGRVSIFICLVSLLLCAVAIGISRARFNRSLKQTVDKGVLLGETKISHTFSVPNYSWRSLHIGKVTTSCGCTVVRDLSGIVRPFEHLSIPVGIDLSGRSGKLTSKVSVDLGRGHVAELSVIANIVSPLPERIELGKRNQGELVTQTYVLPKNRLVDQSVSVVPAANGPAAVTFKQMGADGVVQIAVTVPQIGGNFEIPIRIPITTETSIEHVIAGYAIREVEPKAVLLSLGYIQKGSVATNGFVGFNSSYGKRFRLRPDLCRHSEYVSVVDASDGEQLRADVKLGDVGAAGIYKERLDFYFEEVEDPKRTVTVPVQLYAYRME